MYHLTTSGKFIQYVVEVCYNDGPYVLCKTQSLEVAKLVAKSQTVEDEYGPYCVGKIIPYESGQEIWLGFPFIHRGAKTLIRDQVTDEQYEELLRETDMATQP